MRTSPLIPLGRCSEIISGSADSGVIFGYITFAAIPTNIPQNPNTTKRIDEPNMACFATLSLFAAHIL